MAAWPAESSACFDGVPDEGNIRVQAGAIESTRSDERMMLRTWWCAFVLETM